jgi:hypothetical protein
VNELVKLVDIEFELELSNFSCCFSVSVSIVSVRNSFIIDSCEEVCLRRKGFGFGLKSIKDSLFNNGTEFKVSIVFEVGDEKASCSFKIVLVESLQKPIPYLVLNKQHAIKKH